MAKSDFNFIKFNHDTYLITNYAGRFAFLNDQEFQAFCNDKPLEESEMLLKEGLFYSDTDWEEFVQNYSGAIRGYRNYLFSGTGLHIFVLTTKCNLSCVYCQASTNQKVCMMTKEIAEKCVDLALQSPSKFLSFEFQGGEPLENEDILRHIVMYTNKQNQDHTIEFNLVSNLINLSDELIKFIQEHGIKVSTSLDGNSNLQNTNRPFGAQDSYAEWKKNYTKLVQVLGQNIGAIQTTTRASLNQHREIVDEYLANGMNRLFLRPLTPLGYAKSRWEKIGYSAEDFLEFYENTLDYILQKNKEGFTISEGHAVIFLDKILNHRAGNYTELRSPCGAGLGQLAYNHDGKIYTCDEGRMLAEMGDDSFLLGTINTPYIELLNCNVCKAVATASLLESLPQCSDCVYAPFCGTCPVLTYAETNSLFSSQPNSYKCKIYKGILDIIFEKLYINDETEMQIFHKWCNTDV